MAPEGQPCAFVNLQALLRNLLEAQGIRGKRAQVLLRIGDEAVLIFLSELSGSADDLIDLRLGPISARHSGWSRAREIAALKKSPARAGLSLQEEPSNVTFTIHASDNSAADCTRDVMAITKMRFLQRRRGRPRWLESLRRDSV
jgi:hypothetical protein